MAQNKSNLPQNPTKDKNAPAKRSFLKDDFPLIRKALIVLVASLLSCVALIGAGKAFLTRQQEGMTLIQAQRSEALTKRRQVENDKQEIHDYQAKYLQLRESGFVGEEKRLDWITHIKSIRENRKLFPITYEIAAQQIFQLDPEVAIDDLELRGSKIELQLSLLHEGDLLNFLDDLKTKGTYTVQACRLKRIDTTAEALQAASLTAECTLYWLTLGERTGSQDAPPQPDNQ